MKKTKIYLLIISMFIPISLFAEQEDTSSVVVKTFFRYVLNIGSKKTTNTTVGDGESGSVPISSGLSFRVSPFLKSPSFLKKFFITEDAIFCKDRTSCEFGIGYYAEPVRIYATYGFRVIRKKDGEIRGFSSNFEKKGARSIGLDLDFDVLGVRNYFDGKISYDGDGLWFYVTELKMFLSETNNIVYLKGFHESYFGTGVYLVFSVNKNQTDIFSGFLQPENRSENVYRKTQGIVFGLTHTWR